MPDLDGFGFWDVIREKNISDGTLIIMMIPVATTKDLQRFREAGISHYLTKPLHLPDLKKTLTSLLCPDATICQ
jgi:DNA-binding response OmpR family regulator